MIKTIVVALLVISFIGIIIKSFLSWFDKIAIAIDEIIKERMDKYNDEDYHDYTDHNGW